MLQLFIIATPNQLYIEQLKLITKLMRRLKPSSINLYMGLFGCNISRFN